MFGISKKPAWVQLSEQMWGSIVGAMDSIAANQRAREQEELAKKMRRSMRNLQSFTEQGK